MTPSDRSIHNPRDRIDHDFVVSAALAIIDHTGLDSLTIRSLAVSIDRDPMTVYRYVATKDALLDAVADSILGDLVSVDGSDTDWRRQLTIFGRHYRELALAHPRAAVLLATRPRATPLGLGTSRSLLSLEGILSLLATAGFTVPEALAAYRLLMSLLRGHVLSETQETTDTPAETGDRLSLALRRLPIEDFPIMSALPPLITAYDGEAELNRGLNVLFDGLRRTP